MNFGVSSAEIVDLLTPYVSSERLLKIETVLRGRSLSTIPVFENIYDYGNLNAVVRTSEGLGFHEIHSIDRCKHHRSANRVTQGTEKWTEVHAWKSTEDCLRHLKERGYQIVATTLEGSPKPLTEINFSQPTAVVFGNEKQGVSPEVLALSDERMCIPISGFVQSFNLSVAAAMTLHYASGFKKPLTPDQSLALKAKYLQQSVPFFPEVLKRHQFNYSSGRSASESSSSALRSS